MRKPKKPAKVAKTAPPATATPKTFHIDRRADAILAADGGNGSDNDLLTTAKAAEWLGVSPQWLETRRSYGGGPPFVRISPKVVRYPRGGLRSWLNQRAHARTAEYSKRAVKKRKMGADSLNAT
jgi:hypothetical protein